MKRSPPIASCPAAVGAEETSTDLRDHQEQSGKRVARVVNVKHYFTVSFLRAEVGGRLQFVMLKYERTEPGRVKAHGRGLSVYSGL